MTCRFCLRWFDELYVLQGCLACGSYILDLVREGFDAFAAQLINLANVRRCRLAAG